MSEYTIEFDTKEELLEAALGIWGRACDIHESPGDEELAHKLKDKSVPLIKELE